MKIQLTNLKFKRLKKRRNTDKLVLHHAKHSTCSVYDIHSWHLDNGWSGIGYHYFIDIEGNVFQGRPEEMIGAHCKYYNRESIGICLQGNFESEYMREGQYRALEGLVKFLCNKYDLDYVFGHNDLNATQCLGVNFPMRKLRKAILGGERFDTYTVGSGDTLESISLSVGIAVPELIELNGLYSKEIKINQILKIL